MPTINIKLEWPGHPKTRSLICFAGKSAPFALVTLWCYAAKYHSRDGILSSYSPDEIESFAGWNGKRGQFFKALIDSKYLDKDTLKLHDWEDHEGHLIGYMEKVDKMNLARKNKVAHLTHHGSPQDDRQDNLQDHPEQSRAVQSSSEQKSPERRLEKMTSNSTASPSTASPSALRAGNEPLSQGQAEYQQRLRVLTDYLMKHCNIGDNGSRTPAVVASFQEQAGRFEKLFRERRPQIGVLTDQELVAAAKVAFVKPEAHTLNGVAAFTTVLYRPKEESQVMEIAQKARNMVGRQKAGT